MSVVKYLLPKLIKKNLKMFVSLILIAALGISLFVAMLSSYTSVLHTFDRFFEEYGFPDVTVMATDLFSEERLDEAGRLQGISDVQGRLCVESEARKGEDTFVSMRCYSMEETDFMRYSVIEQLPESEYAVSCIPMAMEYFFAEYAGFLLGDVFTLEFPNGTYDCVLVATVTSPEWAITYRDEYFNFSTDEFGYVLFSYEDILKMTGLPAGNYNQIMVRTDADVSASEVEKYLLEEDRFGAQPYSYTYETSPQKEFVDSCVVPLKALSYFMAVFFFLLAALMIYLFLYQIIWEQKEISGILMALGTSENKIVWVYLGFGIGVSVMAGISGSVIGYFLTRLVSGLYQDSFVLPYMDHTFSWRLALGASLVMMVIALISVLLAAGQIFRLDPADAMRNHLSATSPKSRMKHSASLLFWGYAERVCFYNALRNKRRLILSLISTILTVTMISLALKYVDAGKYAVGHTFEERMQYDCQVFLKNVSTLREAEDAVADTPGVLKSELFQVAKADIRAGEKQISATLYGVEEASGLLWNRDRKGNILRTKDGIVLARYTAEELQVSVGDTVTVNEKELAVTGIHEENIILVQYVNLETFADITQDGTTGAFLKLEEGAGREEIYAALQKEEHFSYLSMNDAMKTSVEKRLSNTEAGVYIVIIVAVLIGALIIYNMSLINYKERKKVYAIMLTLGMQESEIGRASCTELALQYLISMLMGNLLAIGFGKVLLTMTSTDSVYYTKAFSLSSALLVGICVGVFMAAGHLLAMRQMKKIDIVEELKSKE